MLYANDANGSFGCELKSQTEVSSAKMVTCDTNTQMETLCLRHMGRQTILQARNLRPFFQCPSLQSIQSLTSAEATPLAAWPRG